MALIGTLAYEFQVVLPLHAHTTLHGGAEVFGFLTAAMGVGAVAGGLLVATAGITGIGPLTAAAFAFGLAIVTAAVVSTLATELLALVLVGAASTTFMATGNSTLQLTTDPSFRGRVMALWSVTFAGSTPIGGPIIGAVSEYTSPRYGPRARRARLHCGGRAGSCSGAPHPAAGATGAASCEDGLGRLPTGPERLTTRWMGGARASPRWVVDPRRLAADR